MWPDEPAESDDPVRQLVLLARRLDELAPPVTAGEVLAQRPVTLHAATALRSDRRRHRGRLGFAAVAAAAIVVTGGGLLVAARGVGPDGGLDAAAVTDPTAETPAVTIHPSPIDPIRDLLPGPAGTTMNRYFRFLLRTQGPDGVEASLIEEWYSPSGSSTVARLELAGLSLPSDQIAATYANTTVDLDQVPGVLWDPGPGGYGVPELALSSGAVELANQLGRSREGDLPPSLYALINPSPDGSMFDVPLEQLVTLRELVRLVPHVLESTARSDFYAVAVGLDGATVADSSDALGRSGALVSMSLPLTDPETRRSAGSVTVDLLFAPDTRALLEIRWRIDPSPAADSTATTWDGSGSETTSNDPMLLGPSSQILTVVASGEVEAVPSRPSQVSTSTSAADPSNTPPTSTPPGRPTPTTTPNSGTSA